jgi:hypothetical protein
MRYRGLVISGKLEQMGSSRGKAMMAAQPSIGIDRFEQFESFHRPMHHRGRNCVIERHHGVVGHALQ